jgi:hypothetical protein
MPEWIIQLGVVTMIGGIGWFLRSKDEFQGKQIALLFLKHDEDAKALQELRIQIASNHYVKQELDARFDKLEAAFTSGFKGLGEKFDRLAEKLTHNGNGH